MLATSKKTIMPNFLIIGAAKAGTTALHYYLKQHPQIYMSPQKELKFFCFEGEQVNFRGPGDEEVNRIAITNLEDYHSQFQGVTNEIAIGESTPWYLYSAKAPERIQYHVPDAKLIAILRHPVDRAYSSFCHLIRDGREPITNFAQALREEEKRIQDNWVLLWRYKDGGFYYNQLKRYFDRFKRNQLKIYLYEDLNNNPLDILKDVFQFLNVDENFTPDIAKRYNSSRIPKNKNWHEFLTKSHPIKDFFKPLIPVKLRQQFIHNLKTQNLAKPELTPQIRRELIKGYREDIIKLQDLIQKDLSHWLN